jgi:hypothetical protein
MSQDNTHFYGSTEMEEKAEESTRAHEIVSEIIDFGVSQRQILQIIKRLALNLENPDHMRKIGRLADQLLNDDLSTTIEESQPWIHKE